MRICRLLLRRCVVILSPCEDTFINELLHASEINMRKVALGLDCSQLGPLLPRVELHQNLSCFHCSARIESNASYGPWKICAHRHALHRRGRTNHVQRCRPLLLFRHNGCDGLRGWLEAGAMCDCGLNLAEFHKTEAANKCCHHR